MSMEIRRLTSDDLGLIGRIDRSEHLDVEYTVVDGVLTERPASMTDVPPWDPVGRGPHSVAVRIDFCRPLLANGAAFLGAFDGDEVMGLVVVQGDFEPGLAWLAFLHVSRPYRRSEVASALWIEAVTEARSAGADSMYVSSAPTGSAVGFYCSRGCELADPVHPVLYAMEPDDIHFVYRLGSGAA
jgi:ribosomal protein S18 acetylase RimI-like enzyme